MLSGEIANAQNLVFARQRKRVQLYLATLSRANVLGKAGAMFLDRLEGRHSSETPRQDPRPQADMGADIDRMPKILDVGKRGLELVQLIGSRARELGPILNERDEMLLRLREPDSLYLFSHQYSSSGASSDQSWAIGPALCVVP